MSGRPAMHSTAARRLALLLVPALLLILQPRECAAAQKLPQRTGISLQEDGPGVPVIPDGMRNLSGCAGRAAPAQRSYEMAVHPVRGPDAFADRRTCP
jgi:hypothetical protein